MDRGTCRSCGADVFWVMSEKNNRPMPLDVKPEKRVVVLTDGTGRVVDTFISHFASCANPPEKPRGSR